MAKVLSTEIGDVLTSKVNIHSLCKGDAIVSFWGAVVIVRSVSIRDGVAYVAGLLATAAHPSGFGEALLPAFPVNTPMNRIVGARSAG